MPDQVKFGADAGEYFDVVTRMKKELDELSNKVNRTNPGAGFKRAGDELDGLRLKSEGRVAHNIGEIARSLTSGASAGDILAESITRVSESFRGSLLFGGAAVAGFALYEGITKAGEAAVKLDEQIHNLTRSRGNADFLGTDKINQNLTETATKLKELHDRDLRENNGAAGAAVKLGRNLVGTALGKGSPFDQDQQDQEQKNELRKNASRDIDDLAQKTTRLNQLEVIRVRQGERAAELTKAELENKERLGTLAAAESGAGVQNPAASRAENVRFENEKKLINFRHDMAKLQLRDEQAIADLGILRVRGVISAEKERLLTLREQAEQSQRILAITKERSPGDKEGIAKATITATRAATSFSDEQFTQFNRRRQDPSISLREQQEMQSRKNFESSRGDYLDRARRGAYGQTGAEAEVFGSTATPGGPLQQIAANKAADLTAPAAGGGSTSVPGDVAAIKNFLTSTLASK